MQSICKYEECTGCYACENVCPKSCITLENDQHGEIHPVIDASKCIDCCACQKACPNNSVLDYYIPIKCFATWVNDADFLKECATGGLGTLLSEHMISSGGIVFGTAYSETFESRFVCVNEIAGLAKLKGSKYAHSKVSDSFRKVKKHLNESLNVLFVGTPCQVAGLKCYLKKEYTNLITVDLICHGVAPSGYLIEELQELRNTVGNFTNVRFRGNDGNNYKFTLWDKDRCIYKKDCNKQYYFWGFVKGTILRENCFNCKYARPDRVSDITIGDYIGLGAKYSFEGNRNNKSFVSCNTQKGLEYFMSAVKETNRSVEVFERDYSERLIYKPSLLEPAHKPSDYKKFRYLIAAHGYIYASRNMFASEIRANKIKDAITILRKYTLAPVRKIYRILYK